MQATRVKELVQMPSAQRLGIAFLLGALIGPYGSMPGWFDLALPATIILAVAGLSLYFDPQIRRTSATQRKGIGVFLALFAIVVVLVMASLVIAADPTFQHNGGSFFVLAGTLAPVLLVLIPAFTVSWDLPLNRRFAIFSGLAAWTGTALHIMVPLLISNVFMHNLGGLDDILFDLILVAFIFGLPIAALGGYLGNLLRSQVSIAVPRR